MHRRRVRVVFFAASCPAQTGRSDVSSVLCRSTNMVHQLSPRASYNEAARRAHNEQDSGCKSSAPAQTAPSLKRKASAIDLDSPKPGKTFKSTTALEEAKPLAERVRPSSLDDFVGQVSVTITTRCQAYLPQRHLLAPGALLRNLIDQDKLGSMLLWGAVRSNMARRSLPETVQDLLAPARRPSPASSPPRRGQPSKRCALVVRRALY